jgi:hypothetical protein
LNLKASIFRGRARARARLRAGLTANYVAPVDMPNVAAVAMLRKDADGDSDSTIAAARSRKVDAFAALIVTLLNSLRARVITPDEYVARINAAFDNTLGDVPFDARAKVEKLKVEAMNRAGNFIGVADDEELSEPEKHGMGHMVAGALWAATFVVAAYEEVRTKTLVWQSEADDHVCEDCENLDGEEFYLDEVPFWPGEGDFGENTECGPNCRCKLD